MSDLGWAFVAVVLLIGAGWLSVMRDSDLALVIAAALFVISVVVVVGSAT
jgi:hypothetical protein